MTKLIPALILAALSFAGSAHAECDQGSYGAAVADASEGLARGYHCEVVELENATYEAQCDEVANADESDACTVFVETNEEAWDGADGMSAAYEACMVIVLHTGAVR